jgi:hypothetical protein
MVHRRHNRSERRTVAFQPLGDQPKGNLSLFIQELAEDALCCAAVAARLEEDVDHVSVLIVDYATMNRLQLPDCGAKLENT